MTLRKQFYHKLISFSSCFQRTTCVSQFLNLYSKVRKEKTFMEKNWQIFETFSLQFESLHRNGRFIYYWKNAYLWSSDLKIVQNMSILKLFHIVIIKNCANCLGFYYVILPYNCFRRSYHLVTINWLAYHDSR